MEALEHPERSFLCVHVAGTNGKGSVCAMVASVFQEMGLKVGVFTSPHLVRVNERIRIQGEPISDEELLRCLDLLEEVEGELERMPTFFETLTALAFLVFRDAGVQIAVIETGLGGRLDSTNVVEPLVAGITRIDMDHQAFLGDTLTAIAGEKAGILKPGRPAVIGAQSPEALEVLCAKARELGCPLWEAFSRVGLSGRKRSADGQEFLISTPDRDLGRVRIPLLGAYQMENVAVAVSLVEAALHEMNIEVDSAVIRNGLSKTVWAGRGQMLSLEPPVLLDVAHNPGGASALGELIREQFGRKARGVWVWTSLADKDPEAFLKILRPHISELLCVELKSPRAMSAEALVRLARSLGCAAEAVSLETARSMLPVRAAEADFGCVAGSVYLAGEWLSAERTDPGESLAD